MAIKPPTAEPMVWVLLRKVLVFTQISRIRGMHLSLRATAGFCSTGGTDPHAIIVTDRKPLSRVFQLRADRNPQNG